MSPSRFTKHGGHRLVLVRGGRDFDVAEDDLALSTDSDGKPSALFAHSDGMPSEFLSFAARIGWNTEGAEPDAGFEDRMAERLAQSFAAEVAATGVIEARPAYARWGEDSVERDRSSVSRTRGTTYVAAGALAVAAAALLFAASVLTVRGPSPAASLPVSPHDDAMRAIAPSAPETSPSLAPPDRSADTLALPRDRKRLDDSKATPNGHRPPGTAPRMVARVERGSARGNAGHGAGSVPDRGHATETASYRRGLSLGTIGSGNASGASTTSGAVFRQGYEEAPLTASAGETQRLSLHVPVDEATRVAVLDPPRTSPRDLGIEQASAGREIGTESSPSDGSSWALHAANPRWMGVSVTPSAGSALPGGMGVMAQVDLAKALGKL